MAEDITFVHFRYGTYAEINNSANNRTLNPHAVYIATDKQLMYAKGAWIGVTSVTSEVNQDTGEITLKFNYDSEGQPTGNPITCPIKGAGMTTEQKAQLETAYKFAIDIGGTSADDIINKWQEVVDFLAGIEGGTLEGIVATKADKNTTIIAGDGLTGGGDLSENRTIKVESADDGITVNSDNIQLNTVDNLTTSSKTKPLSANQGKVLDGKVKSVADLLNDMFEKVTDNGKTYIKTKYGFASDKFVSAGGTDDTESGGSGGANLTQMWESLQTNNDTFKDSLINVAHIPTLTTGKISDFISATQAIANTAVANKADKDKVVDLTSTQTIGGIKTFSNLIYQDTDIAGTNAWSRGIFLRYEKNTIGAIGAYGSKSSTLSHLYLGWGASPSIAANNLSVGKNKFTYKDNTIYHAGNLSPVTTDTEQTITGEKTFSFGYDSTFSFKSRDPNLTIDVNTTGGWTRGLKWVNSAVENYGHSLLGTYGSYTDILYMYMGFDGETATSNPSFRFYKGGKLTHKTLDVQESAHANMIANLNADKLDDFHAKDFAMSRARVNINSTDYNYMGYGTPAEGWLINGPVLSFGSSGYRALIQLSLPDGNIYTTTNYDGTIGENWKRVAFTDSNVASATKLETPRTIWGQSFDGTNNVSGTLYLGANSILGGDNLNILSHSASGYLDVGYGNATAGYSTYINGNSIHFRYSTAHNTGMFLSSNGNVGIGTVTPTAKLHVNGDTTINGKLTVATGALKIVDANLSYDLGTLIVDKSLKAIGTMSATQGVFSNYIKIGNATISWNPKGYLVIDEGLASHKFISAGGVVTGDAGGGGGGLSLTDMWVSLNGNIDAYGKSKIHIDHIPLDVILSHDDYENDVADRINTFNYSNSSSFTSAVKELIVADNIPTLEMSKIEGLETTLTNIGTVVQNNYDNLNESISTLQNGTIADHEARIKAIEKALTWQTV